MAEVNQNSFFSAEHLMVLMYIRCSSVILWSILDNLYVYKSVFSEVQSVFCESVFIDRKKET